MDINIRETVSRIFKPDDAAPDALSLIHGDHEEVAALFTVALDDGKPARDRRGATAKILTALTVHAAMEEALFYPALRKAGKATERDSVLEAVEEHGLVKDLIAKIERADARDETITAKLTVLKEIVEHHVREEESTIFPEARRTLGDRLKPLGEEMLRFKQRSLGQTNGKRATSAKKTSAKKAAARRTASSGKTVAKRTAKTRAR